MKTLSLFSLMIILLIGFSCSRDSQYQDGTYVEIETDMGNMIVKLYDETPKHKENFLRLVNESYYDDLLFHRVIEGFMIQGGDPESKDASADQSLGNGGPEYTIPAEINSQLFHKKGALAAARQSDSVNPQKESSGSQFYIVQGNVYTEGALDTLEMSISNQKMQIISRQIIMEYQQELMELQNEGDSDVLNSRIAEIQIEVQDSLSNIEMFSFPEEIREVYTTIGGTPSLDNEYTVFGEVVEGLEVIDKIAAVETNSSDRPLSDMKMKIKVLE